MEIFELGWIGFVLTTFGTLFLIGELLVNMRGIFGLIGIGFITLYFSVYLETDSFIIMIIVYFIGLLLIIIDGKLLNDGTLATLGLACMLIAVAVTAPDLYAGMYAAIGVIVGGFSSLFFLKVFRKREMWTKITLVDQLTKEAGYNSMNESYVDLVNKKGITLNNLRPVGTIRIEEKDYSAISNGQWIPKGTNIRVVQVDGTRIMVEEIK